MQKSRLLILMLVLIFSFQVFGFQQIDTSTSSSTSGFSNGLPCSKDTDCASGLKCWEIKKTPGISICDDKFTPSLRNSIVATGKYGKVCTNDADCKNSALGCFPLVAVFNKGVFNVCDIKAEHPYIEAVKAKIDTELKTHSVAKNFCTNKWYMRHPDPCMEQFDGSSEWYVSDTGIYPNALSFVGSKNWENQEGYRFTCSHFAHNVQWAHGISESLTKCSFFLSIFDYDIIKDNVKYLSSLGETDYSENFKYSPAKGITPFSRDHAEKWAVSNLLFNSQESQKLGYLFPGVNPQEEGFNLFYDDPWNTITQFVAHYPTGEKSILTEITETTSGDTLGAVMISENCQVSGDEDGDGKRDCQDLDCKGKILTSSSKKEILCFNENSNVCGEKNFPTGTTVSNYLCNPDGTWTKGGCVDGTLSQDSRFFCIYSIWQECTKSSKFQGKAFGKYICNNNKWLPIPTTSTTTALGSKIKPVSLPNKGDFNGDGIITNLDIVWVQKNPQEMWMEQLGSNIFNLNALIKARVGIKKNNK